MATRLPPRLAWVGLDYLGELLVVNTLFSEFHNVHVHGRPEIPLMKAFEGYGISPGMITTYPTMYLLHQIISLSWPYTPLIHGRMSSPV